MGWWQWRDAREIALRVPMLSQSMQVLEVDTAGAGFTDLTGSLNREIAASGLQLGTATLVCQHTSASLTINENADPRVLHDLTAAFAALAPEAGVAPLPGQSGWQPYRHNDEGPDDMPSHIRTALTATSLSLTFQQGRLLLGTWQAVYLWEHRRAGQRRRLSLHLIGA